MDATRGGSKGIAVRGDRLGGESIVIDLRSTPTRDRSAHEQATMGASSATRVRGRSRRQEISMCLRSGWELMLAAWFCGPVTFTDVESGATRVEGRCRGGAASANTLDQPWAPGGVVAHG